MIPILLLASVALAEGPCFEPVDPTPYVTADDPTDIDTPDTPSDVAVVVDSNLSGARPDGSQGCGSGPASCPDVVLVELTFEEDGGDDVTAADDLGYTFELLEGTLPPGITLPEGPVEAPGGVLTLVQEIDPQDAGQAFDVVFRVRAIDRSGKAATSFLDVSVNFDGVSPATIALANCQQAPGSRGLLLGLFGLLLARRRRRPHPGADVDGAPPGCPRRARDDLRLHIRSTRGP